MKRCLAIALVCGSLWQCEFPVRHQLARADWTQFRGPGGNATSDATGVPLKWSEVDRVLWRVALPGLGTSSPIVLKDRVFVTCYSGYAESVEAPGNMDSLLRHVLCLDRATGSQIWNQVIEPELPESRYEGGNNARHGYSSSTPTSDGQHLYVFFGRTGVFCFDLDGKQVWRTKVGDEVTGWGSGTSPVLFNDLLIVNASVESHSLVALDKSTGREKWRVKGIGECWNTPTLVPIPGGKTELVLSLPEKILAIDPATGKQLWHCQGVRDRGYVCPSAISHEGIVYAIGGRSNTALAVRAGGSGDVTEAHVLWSTDKGSNVSSPVYVDGRLYWTHESRGMLQCVDARTGKLVFEQRIEPRPGIIYSSLVAADGKLYAASQNNGTYVFAAKPQYELLAHNVFGDDSSRTNASPAIDGGRIFLRTDKHLYCIGD